jgi:hypothetical protein
MVKKEQENFEFEPLTSIAEPRFAYPDVKLLVEKFPILDTSE